nr:hypothetical protein GCM10025699_16940 [Microbacterium flavescens]
MVTAVCGSICIPQTGSVTSVTFSVVFSFWCDMELSPGVLAGFDLDCQMTLEARSRVGAAWGYGLGLTIDRRWERESRTGRPLPQVRPEQATGAASA